SESMEKIKFDGVWSHEKEWKQSSYEHITSDQNIIHLKIAHFKEFIYILIDAEDDTSLNFQKDFSIVCFDGENNKSLTFDSNDFCFKLTLGSNSGDTLQGNSSLNNLSKIDNHNDLILISSKSGEHNRYELKLHGVYEFRIPIELIDRSNNYGFFMMLHDEGGKIFSWPEGIVNSTSSIPPPNLWGDIISPDDTLPEFHFILIIFIVAIIPIIFISKHSKLSLYFSY
ncbi:MAG: hypothetical protein ACE5RC_04750, partial [Nitrosopumilus sp.]